tara:strand:- start:105 stop:557 length:453 start_codon:yes stop_codon:yes gene_type:complete
MVLDNAQTDFIASVIANAVFTVDGLELLQEKHISIRKRLIFELNALMKDPVGLQQVKSRGITLDEIKMVLNGIFSSVLGMKREEFLQIQMARHLTLADIDNPLWKPGQPRKKRRPVPKAVNDSPSEAQNAPRVFAHSNFAPRTFLGARFW